MKILLVFILGTVFAHTSQADIYSAYAICKSSGYPVVWKKNKDSYGNVISIVCMKEENEDTITVGL